MLKKLCLIEESKHRISNAKAPKQKKQVDPEQVAQRQAQKLSEELNLTNDQKAKVVEINKDFLKKLTTIKAKMAATSEAEQESLKKEIRKNNQEKNKQIKALLTNVQLANSLGSFFVILNPGNNISRHKKVYILNDFLSDACCGVFEF